MRRFMAAGSTAVTLAIMGAVDVNARPEPRRQQESKAISFSQAQETFEKHLKEFDETGRETCDTAKLKLAEFLLEFQNLSREAYIMDALNRNGKRIALEIRSQIARNYIKLADAAATYGCYEQARAFFLKVIEDYVGSGYAAIRQRAQVGLDDLRALRASR